MKYAGLSKYLMEKQLEIEQKYTNDLSKINKDVFSNKCTIKISTTFNMFKGVQGRKRGKSKGQNSFFLINI